MGNYGVPNPDAMDELGLAKFFESSHIQVPPARVVGCTPHSAYVASAPQVAGLVVQEVSSTYSHWNAHMSLQEWLRNEGVPAIEGIDTRAVTKKIRSRKVHLGPW